MKRIAVIILLFSVFAVSCEKDFLDGTKPENKISDADVWQSPALANKVIDGCYLNLPAGHTWFMMMSATDEGMFQYNDLGTPYTMSSVSPQFLGCFATDVWAWGELDWNWNWVYTNIRNITNAIANLNSVPYSTQDDKDKAIADAYFIRGFSYFLLMAQYGGVVLYNDPVQLGEDYTVPRSSFEETVNFIVHDLDTAISLYKDADIGAIKTRGDKGVAMAVKAKVLLYAASDLHNPAKNGAVAGSFANPELIGYTGGNATERWQAAKDAAKAVIDLGRYSLYTGNADKQRNFEEIFLNRSSEDMFLRYADQRVDLYYALARTPLWQNSPGYGGAGANAVLGDLVDAFEMSDGTKFNWNNQAQAANPYANRDPRFYASVLYDGADWYPRAETENKIRVGTWPDGTSALDGQFTNYWMRKYIDVNAGLPDYYDLTACPPWVRMRYAEVLMNYAEACIELGQDAEARTYINMIRSRAGMPQVTESGDALKQRYRNERRVEFAFEEQRFFDVRRWIIGPESANSGYGVQVNYPTQGSFNNPTFRRVLVDAGRVWNNKAYFLPISVNEMNKNTALIQNPGY